MPGAPQMNTGLTGATFRSKSASPLGVTVVAAFIRIEPDYSVRQTGGLAQCRILSFSAELPALDSFPKWESPENKVAEVGGDPPFFDHFTWLVCASN